jgi:hypothetical protein
MLGQKLATSKKTAEVLAEGLELAKKKLGVFDYAPIGTAFQIARTVEEWAKLEGEGIGTAGAKTAPYVDKETGETKYKTPYPLLYKDCQHMQAGIPALLATYIVVLKILEVLGEMHRGLYNSSFIPTIEACYSINVAKEDGDNHKPAFTHGLPDGVDNPEYIKAIQDIAYIAINSPTTVTNCTDILNYQAKLDAITDLD